jgi:plastocyanin
MTGPAQSGQAVHSAQIEMKDIAFVPRQLSARVGDQLVWKNDDIVDHTATSDAGGFDVVVRSGQSASTKLTKAGTFSYICRYHPNMRGEIRVRP